MANLMDDGKTEYERDFKMDQITREWLVFCSSLIDCKMHSYPCFLLQGSHNYINLLRLVPM